MCGIVGYTGGQEATSIIIEGLRKLEYRGYDSAGICTMSQGKASIRRSEGKLVNLERLLLAEPICGTLGIGHTRWATHGAGARASEEGGRAAIRVVATASSIGRTRP